MEYQGRNLTDYHLYDILKEVTNKEKLQKFSFNLENNKITDGGVEVIVDFIIRELPSLEELYLSFINNKISNKGLFALFKLLTTKKDLTSLSLFLSGNQITQVGINSLDSIKPLCKLNKLYLGFSRYQMGSELINSLSAIIQKNTDLKELGLFVHDCKIGNEGSFSVCNLLQKVRQIEALSLYIDRNGMTDNGILNITRSIGEMKQLRQLNLGISQQTVERDESRALYFNSSFNVISLECLKKIIHIMGLNLPQLRSISIQAVHYKNQTYLDFMKEGYEALVDKKSKHTKELSQIIDTSFKKEVEQKEIMI